MEEKKLLFTLILLVLVNFKTAGAVDLKEFQTGIKADMVEFAKKLDKQKETLNPGTVGWCSKLNDRKAKQGSQHTKEWITELEKESRQHVNQMEQDTKVNSAEESNLYVFVTFNMSDQNLKALIKEARKYHALVVIRGLKENSMIKTAEHLKSFLKDDLEGMVVDPVLFKEYGITKVPSFVLEQESGENKHFDKLEGNVTIRYALERIAYRGDLRIEARKFLGKST